MIIGMVGMAFLVLAWIPEILDTVKKGGRGIDMRFGLMSLIGDVLLIAYSYQIGDRVFLALNIFIFLATGLEVFLTAKKHWRQYRQALKQKHSNT